MALYEYKCAGCEDRFDLMRPMSDADEPAECPECGSEDSRRVISNFASITPGASSLSSNPVMDARMASGGGCCGGGCGGGQAQGGRRRPGGDAGTGDRARTTGGTGGINGEV